MLYILQEEEEKALAVIYLQKLLRGRSIQDQVQDGELYGWDVVIKIVFHAGFKNITDNKLSKTRVNITNYKVGKFSLVKE